MDTDERLNEERIAALEQRLTALESRAEGCITQDEYRARLASLRAPGVEIPSEPVDVAEMQAQIHEADMDRIAASERLNAANAALATARRERDAYRKAKEENDERFMTERDDARRERDEAYAMIRRLLASAVPSRNEHPTMYRVWQGARALVAGQATPDARDAEIATLRTSLAEAQGEVERLKRSAESWEADALREAQNAQYHREKRAEAEADRDALRASLTEAQGEVARLTERVDEMRRTAEAEDDVRSGRWCAENQAEGRGPCGVCLTCVAGITEDRDALRARLDAAGKLIEVVLTEGESAIRCGCTDPGLCRECRAHLGEALADLRAWGKP